MTARADKPTPFRNVGAVRRDKARRNL